MNIPLPSTGWTPFKEGMQLQDARATQRNARQMGALEAYFKMQKEKREQAMNPLDMALKRLNIDKARLDTDPEYFVQNIHKIMGLLGKGQEGAQPGAEGQEGGQPPMGLTQSSALQSLNNAGQGQAQGTPNDFNIETPLATPEEQAAVAASQKGEAPITSDPQATAHFAQMATKYNQMNPGNPISTDINDPHAREVVKSEMQKSFPKQTQPGNTETFYPNGESSTNQTGAKPAGQYPNLKNKVTAGKGNPGNGFDWIAAQNEPIIAGMLNKRGIDVKQATYENPQTKRQRDLEQQAALEAVKLKNQEAFADYQLNQTAAKAREEGKGKFNADFMKEAVEENKALGNKKMDIDRIVDALEHNPHPNKVIGPFNSQIATLFGNPADQALAGEMAATTGNLVIDTMKNIGGQGSAKEIGQVSRFKTSPTDPFFVMLGKLKANAELTELLQRRSHIRAEEMNRGRSPLEASDIAVAKTPTVRLTDKYTKVLEQAQQRVGLQHRQLPTFHSKEEGLNFLDHITPAEITIYYALKKIEDAKKPKKGK